MLRAFPRLKRRFFWHDVIYSFESNTLQLLQQIINGLMLGGVLAFVAVAFTLTIGMLNFLNFTIPALFMLAGMVTWALSTAGPHWLGWGWHWAWAALAG